MWATDKLYVHGLMTQAAGGGVGLIANPNVNKHKPRDRSRSYEYIAFNIADVKLAYVIWYRLPRGEDKAILEGTTVKDDPAKPIEFSKALEQVITDK